MFWMKLVNWKRWSIRLQEAGPVRRGVPACEANRVQRWRCVFRGGV